MLNILIKNINNLNNTTMNRKIIAGAVVALAAGIATYFYNKNRKKVNAAAADAYHTASESLHLAKEKAEQFFS